MSVCCLTTEGFLNTALGKEVPEAGEGIPEFLNTLFFFPPSDINFSSVNKITRAANKGRILNFWVADGSYHHRPAHVFASVP